MRRRKIVLLGISGSHQAAFAAEDDIRSLPQIANGYERIKGW